MREDIESILFDQDQIQTCVARMGSRITADYAGKDLLLVCTLRGAAIFHSDLARAIDLPLEMDYMVVSSYGDEAISSGKVDITKDISSDICGRHVLIAEDILDTGRTLAHLIEELKARGAASVEIAALLKKEGTQLFDIDCKYVGFECPPEFVVGYGLDYAQGYRNLPYIGILKAEVYS